MSVRGAKLKQPLLKRVVKDAFKPLVVRMTGQHCKLGKPGDCTNCAFALAFKDMFGDLLELVSIGPRVTKIYTPGQVTRYQTPSAVRNALIIFDRTGEMPLPAGEYTFGPLISELRRRGLKAPAKKYTEATLRKRSGAFRARALPTRNTPGEAFAATF